MLFCKLFSVFHGNLYKTENTPAAPVTPWFYRGFLLPSVEKAVDNVENSPLSHKAEVVLFYAIMSTVNYILFSNKNRGRHLAKSVLYYR